MSRYKYLYGPVESWRLGKSLGVDPLSSRQKVCNMDCVYCQLGPTLEFVSQRQVFIPTSDILGEIATLNPYEPFDHITISGRGEPTLAANLAEIIRGIRMMRRDKIAVITNSSLLWREDVQVDLMGADSVLAKLDACNEKTFSGIDVPASDVNFESVMRGLREFRKMYRGHLSLDVMFVDSNKHLSGLIARHVRAINPDSVHINTPLRDCPVEPLSPLHIQDIREAFQGMKVSTVYDDPQSLSAWNDPAIVRRHGRLRVNPFCKEGV